MRDALTTRQAYVALVIASGDSVRVAKTPAPTAALPAGVTLDPYSIVDYERKPPLLWLAVMLTTIPLAHGLGPKSLAAIAGTACSLLLVVGLAVVFTHLAHLTGTGSEEAATLVATNQKISLQSLLIAGMVIGALGVLDDVTVSQASTVMALRAFDPGQRFGELFRRAIDVGRDDVSATVNTWCSPT